MTAKYTVPSEATIRNLHYRRSRMAPEVFLVCALASCARQFPKNLGISLRFCSTSCLERARQQGQVGSVCLRHGPRRSA